jgi:hypothetical protein
MCLNEGTDSNTHIHQQLLGQKARIVTEEQLQPLQTTSAAGSICAIRNTAAHCLLSADIQSLYVSDTANKYKSHGWQNCSLRSHVMHCNKCKLARGPHAAPHDAANEALTCQGGGSDDGEDPAADHLDKQQPVEA